MLEFCKLENDEYGIDFMITFGEPDIKPIETIGEVSNWHELAHFCAENDVGLSNAEAIYTEINKSIENGSFSIAAEQYRDMYRPDFGAEFDEETGGIIVYGNLPTEEEERIVDAVERMPDAYIPGVFDDKAITFNDFAKMVNEERELKDLPPIDVKHTNAAKEENSKEIGEAGKGNPDKATGSRILSIADAIKAAKVTVQNKASRKDKRQRSENSKEIDNR